MPERTANATCRRAATLSVRALVAVLAAAGAARAGDANTAAGAAPAGATVASLYGAKLDQAEATKAVDDDVALAWVIFEDARLREPASALRARLCEKAYDLGAKGRDGFVAAAEAMKLLAADSPADAEACWQKIDPLLRRGYGAARGVFGRIEAGEYLVISMLQRAVADAGAGRLNDAAILLRRAYPVARTVRSSDYVSILSMQKYLGSRMRFVRQSADLRARLKADPTDVKARTTLVRICTIELDDPAAAAGLLGAEIDEAARTYVPLAAKPVEQLSPDVCGELGHWYRAQSDGASSEGRIVAWGRAARYLDVFINSRQKAGIEKMQAQLALKEINGRLDTYKAHYPIRQMLGRLRADLLAHGRARNRLTPSFQLQMLSKRLSETNGGVKVAFRFRQDTTTSKIVSASVDGARALVSLDALAALAIGQLSINNCANLGGDVAALADMPLHELDLSDCPALTSLHGLEGMRLTRLTLNGCSSIRSLAPLRDTPLKQLDAMSCGALKSLEGLEGVPLTSLNLQGCSRLAGDLRPLADSKLTDLDLAGCPSLTSLAGIEKLPLKRLDITGCKALPAAEHERIKQVITLESLEADSKNVALAILRAIAEARAKQQAGGAGEP
jgi:hypothetical protein